MALKQIASPSRPFVNAKGVPLAGGYVTVKAPNSASDVPAYTSAARTSTHTPTNIGLSGSGRVTIWVNEDCDLRAYDKNGNLVSADLGINPTLDGTEATGGLLPNGSFEIDDDADTIPDGWTLNSEAGSTNAIDSSVSSDGAQSFRFTSSGSGGGDLTTTNFFEVNESQDLRLQFDIRSTVAALHHRVRVQWYDITQAFISNSDPYDSTSNPLTFTQQNVVATPPSGARFAKVQLFGCISDVATPGSVYFDRVSAFYPVALSGVFDNVTVQDNEIITTNTNGDLALTPNGTGAVNIGSGTAVDLTDAKNDLNVGSATPASDPHLAFDLNSIQAKTDGTSAAALDIQALGGNLALGPQSGTGTVSLYDDGDLVGQGHQEGLLMIGSLTGEPSASAASQTQLQLFNSGAAEAHATFGFDGNDDLDIVNLSHSGLISIFGQNAGGTVATLAEFDPDTGVTLYSSGSTPRFATATGGLVHVIGDLANDPAAGGAQDAAIDFYNSNNQVAGRVGFLGQTLVLDSAVHGAQVHILGEDNSGSSRTMAVFEPDLYVRLYYDNNIRLETGIDGIRTRGSLSNAPSGGGAQDTRLEFLNSTGTDVGSVGWTSSANLRLINLVHGGQVALAAEDSVGDELDILLGDPDGATTLYYNGYEALMTDATGINVYDTNGSTPVINFYQDDLSTLQAQIQASTASLTISNRVHGAPFILDGENAGGLGRQFLVADADTNVTIKHPATNKEAFQTSAGGISVFDTSGNDPIVEFYQDDLTTRNGYIQFEEFGWTITGEAHGAQLIIRGEDAGGTLRTILSGDPDNTTNVFYNGSLVGRANVDGWQVFDPGGDDPILSFHQDDLTTENGYIEFHGTNGMELRSLVHGAPLTFSAEDTGGVPRDILVGDPDGELGGYHAGTQVWRTVTAANGGLEANNTDTGGGFERVLTESDLTALTIIGGGASSGTTVNNSTTFTDITGLTGFALESSTVYAFEFSCTVDQTATAAGVKFAFQLVSGTVSNARCTGTLVTATATDTDNTSTFLAGSGDIDLDHDATEFGAVHIRGFLTTSTAPTLDMQFAQKSAVANDTTVAAGATLTFLKLS